MLQVAINLKHNQKTGNSNLKKLILCKMAEQKNVPCVVRSPTRDEIQQVVDIINTEGWNTHLEILLDIFDLQPDSSKVAVDEKGQILSMYQRA